MATSPTPLTDIEALNRILSTVGAEKVASTSGLSLIAEIAYQDLKNSMRDIMSHPWGFNTEYDVELTADGDGKITVPADASILDFAPKNVGSFDVVIRDDDGTRRVYDRKTHTFAAFTASSTYKFTISYYLDWLDLPEAAKIYAIALAAVHFQATQVGNAQIDQILRAQLVGAKSAFESYASAQESWSIWDNYDFYKLVSSAQRPQMQSGSEWWGTR
jgi:hypothetical protein